MACAAYMNEQTAKAASIERLKSTVINTCSSTERQIAMNELISRTFTEAFGAGTEQTLTMMYAAMCLALNRLWGFGAKRCLDALVATGEEMLMRIDSDETAQEVFATIGLRFQPNAPFAEKQFEATEDTRTNRLKKFREDMGVITDGD